VERGRWLRAIPGRSDRPRDFLKAGRVLGVLSGAGIPTNGGKGGEEG